MCRITVASLCHHINALKKETTSFKTRLSPDHNYINESCFGTNIMHAAAYHSVLAYCAHTLQSYGCAVWDEPTCYTTP